MELEIPTINHIFMQNHKILLKPAFIRGETFFKAREAWNFDSTKNQVS